MIIDVNVTLSRWPFRRLRGDEPGDLVSLLRSRGVEQAWAGSFDGLLHKDIAGVNLRLAADCKHYGGGMLIPFGSVHPKLPDWEEDLRRCAEEHRMPGIRLHPNYHGYMLDDPDFERLLRAAAGRGLAVQVALKMEDDRVHHPLLRVAPVDASGLGALVARIPGLRLMILNGPAPLVKDAIPKAASAGIGFDFAMQEGITGVAKLIDQVGVERVFFGSHFPFFTWDSSWLKVVESGLEKGTERAILAGNAERWLAGR
ncbi:MAG TPA: amidohydrolase family protein [Planctomycetota bacterium]|nr:amidohydrolase family protein [Planctomycetota bacterium]